MRAGEAEHTVPRFMLMSVLTHLDHTTADATEVVILVALR